jgi:hypothetical protein
MSDDYKHVYCLDCIKGQDLLSYILEPDYFPEPLACKTCYPYDIEDSRGNDLRVNYVEKETTNEKVV